MWRFNFSQNIHFYSGLIRMLKIRFRKPTFCLSEAPMTNFIAGYCIFGPIFLKNYPQMAKFFKNANFGKWINFSEGRPPDLLLAFSLFYHNYQQISSYTIKNEPVEPSSFLVFTVTLVKIYETIEVRKSYCFYQLKIFVVFAFRRLGTFHGYFSPEPPMN